MAASAGISCLTGLQDEASCRSVAPLSQLTWSKLANCSTSSAAVSRDDCERTCSAKWGEGHFREETRSYSDGNGRLLLLGEILARYHFDVNCFQLSEIQ